jgi:hypothetical protein
MPPITRFLTLGAIAVAGSGALAGAAHASAFELVAPVTDNYKAQYNADPTAPELRTWLSSSALDVDGLQFTVASPPADHVFTAAADGIDLTAPDGTVAHLTASTTSPNSSGQGAFRVDSSGDFGILATVKDRAALQSSPILESLTVASGGQILASSTVVYSYDPDVADAPPGSIEYNGPGGAWLVDGQVTALDWQAGRSSVSPTPTPTPPAATTSAPVAPSQPTTVTTAAATTTTSPASASAAATSAPARPDAGGRHRVARHRVRRYRVRRHRHHARHSRSRKG